jgi:coenzyme F420-0:L-glutamate ligase/coenzyme F420-1:gamma-L-glutamate ligase
VLLPEDADASARAIRASIHEHSHADVGVVVADSFGRPFRLGTTDVALGVAGLAPLRDLRGTPDRAGVLLRSTQVAVADEIAAAADLLRAGKDDGIPAVVVRGLSLGGDGSAQELVMPPERDLFR